MVNSGIVQRKPSRQRGASLVEILVATAIIAGGLLVVMRLFPTGLTGLKHSEKINFAHRLCQLEIERLNNSAASLPDAIVAKKYDDSSGTWVIDTEVYPGDFAVPKGGKLPWALDAIRDIVGEVANIPLDPPVYVSLFAPIEVDDDNPDKVPNPVVYGARYKRLTSQDVWYYGGIPVGCYTINLDDGILTFNDSEDGHKFRISYRYIFDTGSGLVTYNVVGEDDAVSGNTVKLQAALNDPTNFKGVVEGTDYVYRAFERVDQLVQGEDYQYTLVPATGVFTFQDAMRGAQVRIDYRVASWQTIREDRIIPSVDPNEPDSCYRLRLLMPALKADGYIDDDEVEFEGIPGTQYLNVFVNVLVVDTATNAIIYEKASSGDSGFTADFLHGILFFDDEYADRRVKIYYQTEDEFALQATKAVSAYSLAADPGSLAYSEYAFSYNGLSRLYLNFHRCELDKVVTVDYDYQLANDPNQGKVYRKTGEICTIHQPLDQSNNPFTVTGFGITLNDNNGDDVADTVRINGQELSIDPRSVEILSVRGVSVKARAFWKEHSKWDRRDLDTYITRE